MIRGGVVVIGSQNVRFSCHMVGQRQIVNSSVRELVPENSVDIRAINENCDPICHDVHSQI